MLIGFVTIGPLWVATSAILQTRDFKKSWRKQRYRWARPVPICLKESNVNKFLVTIFGLIAAFTASSSAFAQSNTANATASGSVTLVRPLTITKTADLNFGRIVKPASGSGTVTMANSSDTAVAAVGAVALAGISTSRAKFTINGEGGQVVNVTVPASFVITDGTPADNITVTLNPDLGASVTLSNALAAAGSASLNIGGNLSVPSANSTGLYTGTFTVTVAYN